MERIGTCYRTVRHKIGRSRVYNRWHAGKLATGSKRLDLCSADIAEVLHLSGLSGKLPIRDKVCLELGSGWVLSHSCVFYLLGAKRVISTDVERIAYPAVLHKSIHKSALYIVNDVLAPFEEHHMIKARLNELLKIKTFTFDVLEKLNINYLAPINLASQLLDTKIDFVYSKSVLEHVPTNDILPLLDNLANSLSDEGIMIHFVHLEDHQDFNAPFDFLSEPEEKFTKDVQNLRGNRLRKSQWRDLLSRAKDMEFSFIFEWKRKDKELPSVIDSSIHYIDEEDLRTCLIGILGKKIRNQNKRKDKLIDHIVVNDT
jgi:hypothetical protein